MATVGPPGLAMPDMAVLHDAALVSVGAWLFFYRLALRTRLRPYAEALTTVCCGLALALLAPLLSWPPPGFRVMTLALVGVLLSCCHLVFTATVVAIPIGIGCGALIWQLGLCSVAPGMHAVVLSATSVIFVGVFVWTPGVAGPNNFRLLMVPMLSALLLAVGAAGLAPAAGGLGPRALLQEVPCAADTGDITAPLVSLAAWLLMTACGVGFQRLLNWSVNRKLGEGVSGQGDLAKSLLPGEAGKGGQGMQRPENMESSRFHMLCNAIFADEGADLSHLTDNEQKIVEICRKDEFERDRLLWGGGLI